MKAVFAALAAPAACSRKNEEYEHDVDDDGRRPVVVVGGVGKTHDHRVERDYAEGKPQQNSLKDCGLWGFHFVGGWR